MNKIKSFLEKLNIKQKIGLILAALLIVILAFIWLFSIYGNDQPKNEIKKSQESNNEIEFKLGIKEKENKTIMVDISGEIITPGVVKLPEGSRIIDAITAAGGKTEDADLSKVNLAYILDDGVQLYIPRYNEKLEKEIVQTEPGIGIIQEGINTTSKKDSKVNINTANKEKLATLPGIGEGTAEKIIEYRSKTGKFNVIDEIKKIPGIGESKFKSLKDKITIK
ncbi:MAG: helix-hairpin-helix domain-containing protein [Clostridiales bacterium]|nr:helix-hairpin-helix domain-containing protein [Clostridiales bacterium]